MIAVLLNQLRGENGVTTIVKEWTYRVIGVVAVAWLLGPVGRCAAHHRLGCFMPQAERFRAHEWRSLKLK